MNKLKLIGAAALLAIALPGWSHHAFTAEFDAKQPIDIKGVVTKTKWVNPHSWIYIDVTAPDGRVTNWGFEFGAPSTLLRLGLTKSELPVGTEILIKGYRSRSGLAFGYTVTATLADGRTFQVGAPQDVSDARFTNIQK